MKLLKSSTFQFCAMVLVITGIAAFNGKMTWLEWMDQAVYFVGLYTGKEGIKYGSEAYKQRTS